MRNYTQFYIDGEWVEPQQCSTIEVVNPATEDVCGHVSVANISYIEKAIRAAKQAFASYSQTSVAERIELLNSVANEYEKREKDIAQAITEEMGAPKMLSENSQANCGAYLFRSAAKTLKNFEFGSQHKGYILRKEPIGVCAFITPWNWPIYQIGLKLGPALATGCTSVWKPSEISPFSAYLLTEVLDAAGVPKGVVNLLNGDGPSVGSVLSSHADIDMVSFTGSTRAGVAVAEAAAPTIKRVTQELGGKSANILLDDLSTEQMQKAVAGGVKTMCYNSGQNCNAPSRMLVPQSRLAEVEAVAAETMKSMKCGNPEQDGHFLGPVVSANQWNRIQSLIQSGLDEGAKLLAGGLGKPQGLERGFYVQPTVFSEVNNGMKIAEEEIFGPVLSIIPYATQQQAIEIANDTPYGLSGYISGASQDKCIELAAEFRSGMVHVNGATMASQSPFGGYKQSGNGRESGEYGFEECLEIKAIFVKG